MLASSNVRQEEHLRERKKAQGIDSNGRNRLGWKILLLLFSLGCTPRLAARQHGARQPDPPTRANSSFHGETTRDDNQRLGQLLRQSRRPGGDPLPADYRIGPQDMLQISVFDAPDLDRTVRVSADGEISVPLLGNVRAAGLTSHELGDHLEKLLRRTYMKQPQVSVLVRQIKSHPLSIFGAVQKPGVYEIRGPETLIEALSRAQGLASDAGNFVIVMRRRDSPAAGALGAMEKANTGSIRIDLRDLLDSADPRYNVLVYPGDVVKVTRAGIVYVVGEVRKPGGFLLKTNENISVLQALSLAEGLTRTSAARHARIIRTDRVSGKRLEIPINLRKILAGKTPDPMLRSRDIVFVPNSTGRAAFYRGAEAALSIAGGVIIYRR